MQTTPSRRVQKKVRPPQKHGYSKEALDDTLARLSRAIEEIQAKNASKLSFEEHYRYAYTLCLHKHAQTLYDAVTKLVIAHLEREAQQRIEPAFPTSSLLANYTTSTSAGNKQATTSSVIETSASSVGPSSRPDVSQGRLAQSLEGETFLNAVKGTWEDHKVCMGKLRDVLKYMDKSLTEPNGMASTYTLGLHLFLENFIRNQAIPIKSNVLNVSLALIRIERDGEIVTRGLLKTLTDMMCELREVSSEGKQSEGESLYKSWWEELFLDATRRYYENESEVNLETCSAPECLLRIEKRLQEESDRVDTYLHPSTHPLLFSLLEQVLISDAIPSLIAHPSSGLSTLLAENKVPDLSRMYTLFGKTGAGHQMLTRAIKAWIVEQGSKFAETAATAKSAGGAGADGADEEEGNTAPAGAAAKGKGKAKEGADGASAAAAPKAGTAAAANNIAIEWVAAVLAFKDKMDNLWMMAFEKDRAFQTAINDGFVTFINEVKKAAEYISIFLDDNMRKGVKGKTEAEVDAILDKTIVIFRYLTDKDLFEDYYKRHLAKRLLNNRSVSDDAERGMLQKLKLECGAQFVSKLEGMLKDVGFSDDLNTGYRRYLEGLGSSKPSIELGVQVCTSSFWPHSSAVPCIIPPELVKITKSFERYFDTRYTGRKLTWQPEYGLVDVKVRFDKGTKELNVATHGMVVLSQFESLPNGETLSYPDLLAATGLPEPHLKRTLQSLACAKFKILKKDPATRTISASDTFSFISSFAAPMMKIKIQTIANRVETTEEAKETDERLDKERSQVIEAALVRIMKNRKQMLHSELVNEVTSQLSRRFTPKTTMVKLAMERLIEREYLERDDKDRKLLRYLA